MGKTGNKLTSTDYSRNARAKNWEMIGKYFGGRRCMVCAIESDLPIYDLHHHDQEGKETHISRIIHHSWSKVEKELRKCILVCSNCHKMIHHIERERKK